jgi:hypothetical protein
MSDNQKPDTQKALHSLILTENPPKASLVDIRREEIELSPEAHVAAIEQAVAERSADSLRGRRVGLLEGFAAAISRSLSFGVGLNSRLYGVATSGITAVVISILLTIVVVGLLTNRWSTEEREVPNITIAPRAPEPPIVDLKGAKVIAPVTTGSTKVIRSIDDLPNAKKFTKINPLHEAAARCDVPGIHKALREGNHHDSLDSRGNTPLAFAVKANCADGVRALLRAGADPRQKMANGQSAFDIARQLKFDRIQDILHNPASAG